MPAADGDFSIGVEEEYQIVDPVTRELRPRAGRVLPRAQQAVGDEVTNELFLSQIEIGTPVCRTLADVRAELVRLRKAVIEAARKDGSRIAAAGTHPFSHWGDQSLTPKPRYRELADDFQQITREQIICGCHVHIGIADPEAVIQVMNRARIWFPVILALSANSPFWLGDDTGYASYRASLFGRFPMTGTPHPFASRAEFDELVAALQSAGVVEDGSFLYWDARPSSHVKTLEFRVADVCMTIDEAVLIAGLTRALARACHDEWIARPAGRARPSRAPPRRGLASLAVRARGRPDRRPVSPLDPGSRAGGGIPPVSPPVAGTGGRPRRDSRSGAMGRSPWHRCAASARGPLPGRTDGGRGRPHPGGDGEGSGLDGPPPQGPTLPPAGGNGREPPPGRATCPAASPATYWLPSTKLPVRFPGTRPPAGGFGGLLGSAADLPRFCCAGRWRSRLLGRDRGRFTLGRDVVLRLERTTGNDEDKRRDPDTENSHG